MKKIMTVFGTRPEAVKMAPLILALQEDPDLQPIVVVTAQHREMLDSVLASFDIKPDYDLDIMKQGQTLSDITSRILTRIEDVIKEERPDMILVHGDTMTTFAGSLAALYNQIPIGHVEAGLRTFDKYAPFPEEMNRQMVGVMADLHFAPTNNAATNLLNENKPSETIVVTGNTAIDAMNTTIHESYESTIINKHKDKRIILLTAHRRENIGEPMTHIFKAVRDIVDRYEDVVVVYPVHKNPKVREIADKYLSDHSRIELIEPLEVVDFHNFAHQAYLILTDSGGVQEEAPSLGKPVLVLRDTTERPEGVEAGTLRIVGTNEENIFEATQQLLDNATLYEQMSHARNPYGDGLASKRICENIKYYFQLISEKPESFK
ncbi:UDP-N-acetylglucosamine 2-epimerase (non-hydrolyzing) [Staphylococcus gallinarum]|jgi:UDP-N-acetylglucosamine 2-epimerase (non-hydrolysing)|uniref:UDP-N-acetylglucosamine 2-epimerase (non-hydrolyzing) n=1 Tax=Staphylococcus gallinarum TaxID=1293 RepID=A0A0D0SFH5_STAGA|nr:UDP-N-acetylglucosamine 2-epimerase (non-hydrolyzing) [Staphylococcus gallinarum]KIR11015.1 UDP-N-acetylglucosamine 2-epimerase [Staphylococcus gallinarum]MBU7218001.1 UDP-N-acetylglucosamine 2-epimerase (non-hydrolyzing) [Staphylococcus gallinarum]MCD8787222.1 UDP-N-acetylglucosamine 2-epimerase (non-hydrolyzing) [Staphylococcus gallinarum]MCD8794470.1 UDP-N-acetylglucosamine 2-epimerase (non-hydrolyzing) [Staphylococcus gallinarum]MCD8822232.1 UDP-N-acetylglucosamine 2-epimerase (non-hydr